MNTQEDKLLRLIEHKAFSELSTDERAVVCEQITEAEYELRRTVLHESREIIEEESTFLTPDARITSNLREAMAARKPKVSAWGRVSSLMIQPIPAYQLAAVLVGALVLFTWKVNTTPAEIVYQDKIVYQEKHDTVFVDRPVVEVQTVEKIVKVVEYVVQGEQVTTDKVSEPYLSEKDRMEAAAAERTTFAFSDQELERQQEKSYGNSGVDTRELAKLIGVLN